MTSAVFGIGPHEVLLLANGNVPDSVEIAKTYAKLRQIPDSNIVVLDLPLPKNNGSYLTITAQDFTKQIWTPALDAMRSGGIDDHILVWVYSTHFPIRTVAPPVISIQGLTFLRNHMPLPKEIGDALYVSPLFAGPESPKGNRYAPKSFDASKQFLRKEMPLPSMMLGYIGQRGNSKAEVLNCLKTGIWSDGTKPKGTIYYVISSDIRSRCREWEFASAARGLQVTGIKAVITDRFPAGKHNVMGIMMGKAVVDPSAAGKFLPGCMAEHLTSFAARFDLASQTKLSRWIAEGATASAGAVSEPMSDWRKFPSAGFFNHYSYGCTMIESFYQSIRCPLQIMLVGEPLAAPWGLKSTIRLRIRGFEEMEMITAPRKIDLLLKSEPGISFSRFVYLVDGRVKGEGKDFVLDPAGLKAGKHKLRAVAYRSGFVRSQIFDIRTFKTK
jgi:uncharacterized protein (TIGR03790 family)